LPEWVAIPPHTPLAALPAAVLDLETTGLDVERDRIVQVAIVAMLGPRILDAPRVDRLVDPGVPIPETSTRIHRIAAPDVAGAPRFQDVAEELRDSLAGRVAVGHHVAFDLAVLHHESRRADLAWLAPTALDVAVLAGALSPSLPDLDLETVAKHVGVAVVGRHSALGDAMAAAEIFARLVPLLRDRNIRTLGEAQAFAARRDDLIRREIELGWHAHRSDRQAARPSTLKIDAYVFQRPLGEIMSSPPIYTSRETTLRQAGSLMVERRIGALLVGEEGVPPEGIVTERDLLRAATREATDPDETAVGTIMTSPVECMDQEELLYRALARMHRLHIRHLCVIDDQGIAVGMVSQRDLLDHRARAATVIDDALAEAEDAQSLAAAYAQLPRAAAQLSAEGVGGAEIARVISTELCALSAKCVSLVMNQIVEEAGVGAPAPWCFFLLGSAGRGESLLAADQDNALIHAGAESDDAWFSEVGARVSALLDEAGVPRCKGGVMAVNAAWRGTDRAWRDRVGKWMEHSRPEDLLNVDIFFDLAPVAGDLALGQALHRDAVREATRHPLFLALLAASVQGFVPRIGLFGKLPTVEGRIDLKRDGLLPIVSFARALALRVGSTARPTSQRLRDAAASGRLGTRDAAMLTETHDILTGYILRQQLADLDAGIVPSGRVVLASLTRPEQRDLRKRLHALDATVNDIRAMMAR
jgi:DNA polymerase-3 subunit epsilon/CBS domain-containing protein